MKFLYINELVSVTPKHPVGKNYKGVNPNHILQIEECFVGEEFVMSKIHLSNGSVLDVEETITEINDILLEC